MFPYFVPSKLNGQITVSYTQHGFQVLSKGEVQLYDIAALLRDAERYVIESVTSRFRLL
jgi:hypothetical protein